MKLDRADLVAIATAIATIVFKSFIPFLILIGAGICFAIKGFVACARIKRLKEEAERRRRPINVKLWLIIT